MRVDTPYRTPSRTPSRSPAPSPTSSLTPHFRRRARWAGFSGDSTS
ncbi:MAG: hypothetical protein INR71_02250 [Terriglobus roseus]|nr:hypothetical protein [Terriglobus roseus]